MIQVNNAATPKVSIIIAVLNGVATVGRAIHSALTQTEENIEIIVVDDGSTDGTLDFVTELSGRDQRIKPVRLEKNAGPSTARNIAIEKAVGEWIAILDADDWYEPERIEVLLKAAIAHRADIVFDNLNIFDHAQGRIIERTYYGPRNQVMVVNPETYFRCDNPLKRHSIGYAKPMIRKAFLAKHKIAYDPGHRVGEDFMFSAEVLLNGATAIVVPGAYYVYVHMVSPTTRKTSPSSHTERSPALVVAQITRGCDELAEKYAGSMTPAARKTLLRRQKIFESYPRFSEATEALRQKRIIGAVQISARHPLVLVFFVAAVLKRFS